MTVQPPTAWTPPTPTGLEPASASAPASARSGGEDPWVPAGSTVKINGLVLRGGLLYVGRRLDPAAFGREVEPALIDPSLPVSLSDPDLAGTSLGYALSYSRISPRARAGYLRWLWTGRKDPAAPIGYVYLYFFGLERRMLHDRLVQPTPPGELGTVRDEVERLRAIYGTDDRFRIQAGRFAECLEVLARLESPVPGPIPGPTPAAGELSPVFRLELGRLAATAGRLPPDWALAWVRQAPDIRLRTPAERCPDEFERLFLLRYHSRFGDGLALGDTRARLRLYYRPASPGFTGEVRLPVGQIPDPSIGSGPTRRLAELARSVSDELAAYSRLVNRQPERAGSLAALALLPPELGAGGEAEAADGVVTLAEAALGGAERVLIDSESLASAWPGGAGDRLDREQAATVARILAGHGIGIEPDVRFGGPPLGDGPAVLFRCPPSHPGVRRLAAEDDDPVTVPAASAVIRLAALVAGATGDAVPTAGLAGRLGDRVSAMFGLTQLGAERVSAQLWWALQARPGTSGLKRRLATLDDIRALIVGTGLVVLAAGAGRIGPAQMAALAEAFRLLGLDPADLFSMVHQATVDPLPPWGGSTAETTSPDAGPTSSPAGPAGGLDAERIRARLAETAEVAAFLDEIFIDEDPPVRAAQAPSAPDGPLVATSSADGAPATAGASLAGLDAAHSALLRSLAARSSWSRVELERLAARLDLLPDGALDALNEAALDHTGEAFWEGDDPVEINAFAAQELLA